MSFRLKRIRVMQCVTNAAEVKNEVNAMVERTLDIRHYTAEMKEHADHMEQSAHATMESTEEKISRI